MGFALSRWVPATTTSALGRTAKLGHAVSTRILAQRAGLAPGLRDWPGASTVWAISHAVTLSSIATWIGTCTRPRPDLPTRGHAGCFPLTCFPEHHARQSQEGSDMTTASHPVDNGVNSDALL